MDGGGLGARAAAGHRRRRIPRREIAGKSETGAMVLGLDCGLAVEVHQGTRNPLGRLAGFEGGFAGFAMAPGGASSPASGVPVLPGATDYHA